VTTEDGQGSGDLDEATRLAAQAAARKAGLSLDGWVRRKIAEEEAADDMALRVAALERQVKFHGLRLSLQALGTPTAQRRSRRPAEVPHPDKVAAALAVGAEPGRKVAKRNAYAVLARVAGAASDLFESPVAGFEYLETRRVIGGKTALAAICEGRVVEVIEHLERLRKRTKD